MRDVASSAIILSLCLSCPVIGSTDLAIVVWGFSAHRATPGEVGIGHGFFQHEGTRKSEA